MTSAELVDWADRKVATFRNSPGELHDLVLQCYREGLETVVKSSGTTVTRKKVKDLIYEVDLVLERFP